jgi:hypothetical protein
MPDAYIGDPDGFAKWLKAGEMLSSVAGVLGFKK